MNREDIIRMANKAYGIDEEVKPFHPSALLHLEIFAKLVAEHEREACAEICKKHADVYALLELNPHASGAGKLAWAACIDNRDTIRARGNTQ